MTKQHFDMIARVLLNRSSDVPVMLVAKDLADIFVEANPRFNRQRFLIACGVPLSLDE